MEVRCNHDSAHTRLIGRDSNGAPRTRATAAYSPRLVHAIATVAAHAAGVEPKPYDHKGEEPYSDGVNALTQQGNTLLLAGTDGEYT